MLLTFTYRCTAIFEPRLNLARRGRLRFERNSSCSYVISLKITMNALRKPSVSTLADRLRSRSCKSVLKRLLRGLSDILPILCSVELTGTLTELKDAYDNVEKWASPEKAPFSWLWFAMSPRTRKEPKGTVLIIGPFNYPVYLIFCALVGQLCSRLHRIESDPKWSRYIPSLIWTC